MATATVQDMAIPVVQYSNRMEPLLLPVQTVRTIV